MSGASGRWQGQGFEPAELVREVFGLGDGERLAAPASAPRPGWSRPLMQMAWGWLQGWARPQDGGLSRREVCCVPVWHALAEDQVEALWRPGVLAVGPHGLVAFVQEPHAPLPGVARFEVDLTLAVRVVVGADLPWGTPVARQLGPYAVVQKRVGLKVVEPVVVDAAERVAPPTVELEPWTQQVSLAVAIEAVPEASRRQVMQAVAEMSDV